MRFAPRAGLLVALALVATAQAPPPGDLAAIGAATHHPALEHLRLIRTLTVDRRLLTTTIDQDGVRRLVRNCSGDVCAGTWFDGSQAWAFGPNGVPLPADDVDVSIARTRAAIESFAFVEPGFTQNGGRAEELGTHDGTVRFRVTAPGGTALLADLDAPTDRLRAILTPEGQALPPPEGLDEPGGATVVAEPLAAPRGAVPHLGESTGLPWIDGPPAIVACRLAGRPARCLIDSGTTPSALTLAFADALGLVPYGEIEMTGATRFVTGIVATGPLVAGNLRFDRFAFAIVPDAKPAGFDVLVGSDALATLRTRIDVRGRTVRFEPSRGAAEGHVFPLRFVDGVPRVDVTLGAERESMLLDTGDTSIVSIPEERYRRSAALFRPLGPVRSEGIAGEAAGFSARANVRLDDGDLGPVTVNVTRTQSQGHVGLGLGTRCTLILDYPARRAECAGTLP